MTPPLLSCYRTPALMLQQGLVSNVLPNIPAVCAVVELYRIAQRYLVLLRLFGWPSQCCARGMAWGRWRKTRQPSMQLNSTNSCKPSKLAVAAQQLCVLSMPPFENLPLELQFKSPLWLGCQLLGAQRVLL